MNPTGSLNPTGSFQNLNDWLPWLETLSPREIVLGLDRVQAVLDRLSIRRPRLVINVAGTNGKGSSVAMLEAILRADGVRTGCYTSPHVTRYNERIRIDHVPAGDKEIVAALKRVEAAREDIPLTFFEFGTLAALVAFDAANVDAWILEVGMGGRLDAVNAIDPDASLITNVSLDHCAWLGNDTESIAREKAGVMRGSKPVVFGSKSVPDAIRKAASDIGANLLCAGEDFAYDHEPESTTWRWRGQRLELNDLKKPALSGAVQLMNAAAVLALLEALRLDHVLSPEAVSGALTSVELQGRFQVVDDRWILDVGHNPAAAEALANALRERKIGGKIVAVTGMMADKDIVGFVEPLAGLVDSWIAVTVGGARAESAGRLGRKIANACAIPCRLVEDPEEAFRVADKLASDDDIILVTGSFFIVGPALEWLTARESR